MYLNGEETGGVKKEESIGSEEAVGEGMRRRLVRETRGKGKIIINSMLHAWEGGMLTIVSVMTAMMQSGSCHSDLSPRTGYGRDKVMVERWVESKQSKVIFFPLFTFSRTHTYCYSLQVWSSAMANTRLPA